jgi:hypothetical protein
MRIERRKWTNKDIGFKTSGGPTDLFDNAIKSVLRINDNEYDLICENATDEELELILKEELLFIEKRKLLMILNKYLNLKTIDIKR